MSQSIARSGALLVAVLAAACSPGGRRAAPIERDLPPAERVDAAGELLLASLQCTACHAVPSATSARLRPLAAPDLGDVGARLSPEWMRALLLDPRALQPDGRMPDVLAADDADERAETADDLVHFLASLGGPYAPRPVHAGNWDVEAGALLFETLGCLPCHVDRLAPRRLADKTDLVSLTAFLRDPLATWPSGEMPSLLLSQDEARALASWLLRDQHAAGPLVATRRAGLDASVYELPDFPSAMPDFDALRPARTSVATAIDVSPRTRDEEFALRFSGEVFVATSGEHELWVESDDGSELFVDGRLVIDNDGLHSQTRKSAKVTLDAGWHALVVTMFEAGGDEFVGAGFVEDGVARPFTADELSSERLVYAPADARTPFVVDADKAERGREHYLALGCAACHPLPGLVEAPDAPHLLELAPQDASASGASGASIAGASTLEASVARGCLAERPDGGVPRYALSLDERASLARALASPDALAAPHTSADAADHGMALLKCTACHARDASPGPQGAVRAAFVGSADLGDEGRLPPDLSGVGAKLKAAWLERVVTDGARARPYVTARMPLFGRSNVAQLVPALLDADRAGARAHAEAETASAAPPEADEATIAAGRRLVGRTGLSCISCHTIAGHDSVGIPGPDLARMPERLELDWFRRFLAEPLAMRPGTRMPTFWDEGKSVIEGVLDGDPAAQTDALWAYLSLGEDMPLPPGLLVDRASYDLVPVDHAVWCALFMRGLSARVLAVGFPERVHLAYDEDHVRLARLWRGEFLNAEGTWRARAGKLQEPLGGDVRDLPPGSPFARLGDRTSDAWPSATGRLGGWRLLERRRDAEGRPTFVTSTAGARIEESPRAELSASEARFVRVFFVRAPRADLDPLFLRAAVGASITRVDDDADEHAGEPSADAPDGPVSTWLTDDGLTLIVRGAPAFVRATPVGEADGDETSHAVELLVDGNPAGDAKSLRFEVEMRW